MSEPPSSVVFVTADPGSPAPGWIAGGLTVLERRVREARRAGAARILVAVETALRPELEAWVERVPPGSPPPAGARLVRADQLADIAIDSRAALKRAEWKHMQGMQKSFQGLTDMWLNHHFSLPITRVLAKTPITPNMISIFTIFVGLAACWAIALHGRPGAIAGGILLQLNSILDSCDGELARLRFQFSKLGQWLDNISDDITDTGFIAAAAWAAGGFWWHFGVVVVIARAYLQLDMYRHVWGLGRDMSNFRWWFEADKASLDAVYDLSSWKTYLRALFRRDTYVILWAIFAIAGWIPAIVVYAAIIFGSQAILMLMHSVITATRRRVR
jgi:phosphatidylglycerophosphate synthase